MEGRVNWLEGGNRIDEEAGQQLCRAERMVYLRRDTRKRNSNTLATWCKELTHLKRPWCWERLRAGGEGDDRGRDGWMASLTGWTWVWVNSGSWWWTGRPGVLRFMASQSRTRLSDWTELNWTRKRQMVLAGLQRYCIRTSALQTGTLSGVRVRVGQ